MQKRIIKTEYDCECEICGREYTSKYSNSQYCSNACKQKAYREGYSERKQEQNAIELKLLEQQNKASELELQRMCAEIELKQRENEKQQIAFKLAEERNKEKQLDLQKELQENARNQQRENRLAQIEQQSQMAGALLGNLLSSAFSKKQ